MILILQNLQIYHIKKLLKVSNGKYAGRYGSNVDVRKRSDDFCYILF